MTKKLWDFVDDHGTFESMSAEDIKALYFPLANETLMSSVTPDLHGDIKTGQGSFLLTPVSRTDLIDSRSSRNFWIRSIDGAVWSATGVSKDLRQIRDDKFSLRSGLLWHEITRENKKLGLSADILNFVPVSGEPVEIMRVTVKNTGSKKIKFIPTAAIPIYGRGANNIRDHRHVTSLLQRPICHKFGITTRPTLAFDEAGHRPNKTTYFVLGWDEESKGPQYLYPTQEIFCGDGGDLEAPQSVLENRLPGRGRVEGIEPMGALRFTEKLLSPGATHSYIIVMGVTEDEKNIARIINKFSSIAKVETALKANKKFWVDISQQVCADTSNKLFDNWLRWVNIQPTLRKIFGCSFLPDFDYGRGGRGWRDLWQDCLGLILSEPASARSLLVNNFSGVRIDGSNATIIGKEKGEFISDRNNISRVWMDHGVWPLITLDLYMQETGDIDILFEEAPYFRNHEISRASRIDAFHSLSCGQRLKTSKGEVYFGSILEHLLIENLVQFFNVGKHNHVKLEGADWNDGLDMARSNGESVAFTAMYSHNLMRLSEMLLKTGKREIEVAEELAILLKKVDNDSIKAKLKTLKNYFARADLAVSGKKTSLNVARLADDLKRKSVWMAGHIRKTEWLKEGFFNGYYNDDGKRVEGTDRGTVNMMLPSQVFPIMAGVADKQQIADILKSANYHLSDKEKGAFHLNTDFGKELQRLGRAFSFTYGEKENGAFFNHMTVMFAYALYRRGYAREAWCVLSSIYNMAVNTVKSKIYPCLPEYFNLEGRGMYCYLTGSASWFLLTLLTQVFGVKGADGDLLIEPKLCREQFEMSRTISICRTFAGRKLRVNFTNPKRLDWGGYKIVKARLNADDLPGCGSGSIIIRRGLILKLRAGRINSIDIVLGR
ncbi:MAG: cellobiose phosphorylase [Candidatus Omnitrophica bacterium]|nr:cellobiose phosphorylase [Candidatus Omnitrophota bacterium]